MFPDLLIGVCLSGLLAAVAYRRHSLSASGAAGAMLVGTCIYVGGGPAWFLTLFAFFITSTLLGRVGAARKAATKTAFSKSDRRDITQTLANGGLAAAAAVAFRCSDGQPYWAGLFVGALAACNADTWATELGILSAREPWLITSGHRVPRGTSGGLSPAGTLATIAGGATIGLVAGMAGDSFVVPAPGLAAWTLVGAGAGLAGSLFDSLLGATLQVIYFCPACQKETEREQHACGAQTEYRRGLRGLNNDWVNAAASLLGGVFGAGLLAVLS